MCKIRSRKPKMKIDLVKSQQESWEKFIGSQKAIS